MRQARLVGPSVGIDPRVNVWRPDLAAIELAGTVIASRFATGVPRICTADHTTMRERGDDTAPAISELLFGETIVVFDIVGDWAWGQCLADRYVGWVKAIALADVQPSATHRITVPSAPVFTRADIKSTVLRTLPLNAKLTVTAEHCGFVAAGGGWLHARQVGAVDAVAADPVAIAARFVGVPYVWGGRTHRGIDCSGLTQAALLACGIACPRDSDQQRNAFGADIALEACRRGDLVFFPGHVGILADARTVIHANAFWMETVAEPLDAIIARVPLTGIARPRHD